MLLSPMVLESAPDRPESLVDEAIRVAERAGLRPSPEEDEISLVPLRLGGKATITVLQMGYDEVNRRRGRFRPVLLPGVAFVGEVDDWRTVYEHAETPEERVGFGALAPIPLRS